MVYGFKLHQTSVDVNMITSFRKYEKSEARQSQLENLRGLRLPRLKNLKFIALDASGCDAEFVPRTHILATRCETVQTNM